MLRRQLPVYSPVRVTDVLRGTLTTVSRGSAPRSQLVKQLVEHHGARDALLTDSGTSALVVALRLTTRPRASVAFPAYGCIDLVAAALAADVRVRLYDVDPWTLSPDLDSLRAACVRGVEAVVIAHLYGYPADVAGARAIASEFGLPVIEDAAQGIGASLHGRPLGSFGDLTVLSFGRGKGVTCGTGGALLALGDPWPEELRAIEAVLAGPARGWRPMASLLAQWVLGRPGVYAIPSAIPGLRLGEMVYRPAGAPREMADAAVTVLSAAWARAEAALAARRAVGGMLTELVRHGRSVRPTRVVAGGTAWFLRVAVRDSGGRSPAPAHGLVRGYPTTLLDMKEVWGIVAQGERRQPGAVELARSLYTLPTHQFVDRRDIAAYERWLNEPRLRMIDSSSNVAAYRHSEAGVP